MENKTHWKKLVNYDYFGAYSLQPKEEKILTIAKITREKVVGSGGKKTESIVAHFKERDVKPMILNRTNCKIIAKVYHTNFIEDWTDKKIQVFADIVEAFGDQVEALRIRPIIPQQPLPELKTYMPAFEKVIEHIKGGGKIEDIKNKYRLSDEVKLILEGHVK
jgi:hypothetical protein